MGVGECVGDARSRRLHPALDHYQVFSADQERELLLKGFIEKSQKQLWLFRTILVTSPPFATESKDLVLSSVIPSGLRLAAKDQ